MNYKLFLLLVIAVAAYLLREVLLIMFVSFLLTTALLPIVRQLQRKKIPRAVSAVMLVLTLVLAPMLLLGSMGPVIAEQGKELSNNVPQLVERIENRFNIDVNEELQSRFTDSSGQFAANVFDLTGSILSLLTGLVLVLVITIYWLIYYEQAKTETVKLLTTKKRQERAVIETMTAVEDRLGSWVKGQILVSLTVGLLTWIILILIGMPYAGILAIIAMLLEILPILGPILAAIPALLVAITIGPGFFVIVLIAYIAIQQFESYVIAPRILGRTVKMNPFVILLSIIIGTKLLGIAGALIAVPVTLAAHELYMAYCKYRPSI